MKLNLIVIKRIPVHKRFMMTSRGVLTKHANNYTSTILTKSRSNIVNYRNAGKFRVVKYDKNAEPVTGSGKPLPDHESYHENLQDTQTGKIIGCLTSSPQKGASNYYYISDERLDGTTDPNKAQYLGVYENSKVVTDPKILRVLSNRQEYLDKRELRLQAIAEANVRKVDAERTSKSDTKFYNENGTKDNDTFKGNW